MRQQIETKIDELFTPEAAELLKLHLFPCIRFTISSEAPQIGESKFGGQPDLPVTNVYQQLETPHLQLFAQINMEDVAKKIDLIQLPKQGLLSVFGSFYSQDGTQIAPALPASKQGLQGVFIPDLTHIGRRNPQMSYPVLKERRMELHAYMGTLNAGDTRLRNVTYEPEAFQKLQQAIAELHGFDAHSNDLLFAFPQHEPFQIEMSWTGFDFGIPPELWNDAKQQEQMLTRYGTYQSVVQMTLNGDYFVSDPPVDFSGHLHLGVAYNHLQQLNFQEIVYAYRE